MRERRRAGETNPFEHWERRPLHGDASTRRYHRLVPPAARGKAEREGTPPSAILMTFTGGGARKEAENFALTTRLFGLARCPVPRILHAAPERGFLVLEDLGDLTLERAAARPPFPRPLYDEATALLVRLQAGGGTLEPLFPAVFGRTLGADRIAFELDFFRRHGLERNGPLTGSEARAVKAAFAALVEGIAPMPRVLCHRDYHSRNIMVRKEGIVLVDHQDALTASPFYDLASLLRDSYTTLPPGEEERLFSSYLARARDAGIDLPAEDESARASFDLVAFQRNVKALGTFAYQGFVMGRPRYLESIPRTLKAILRNPAAARGPLASLAEVTASRFEEES